MENLFRRSNATAVSAVPRPRGTDREPPTSRVLYVSGANLVPRKIGPARRNHHLIDQLCRFYDVSVLALGTREHAATFAATFGRPLTSATFVASRCPRPARFLYKLWHTALGRCDFLPARASFLHRACADVTARQRFDAVILSSALLQRLPIPDGLPVIGDAHNVDFDVLRRTAATTDNVCRRQYSRRQMTLTEREERRCAQRVDLMLAASERDGDLMRRQLQVSSVEIVPNGIDVDEFRPVGADISAPVIVFTGLLSYYPNQQGIRWFVEGVFPEIRRCLPGVRLVIAGAAPPRWLRAQHDEGHIEITGEVPDVRPLLAGAAVAVVPLHIGGGTRVKILEAMAMARPVVSTSIGAEGLGLEHGRTILLGDDADSFAAHVLRLLADRDYAAHLAANGRREVLRRFDWNRIGEHLEERLAARFGLIPRSPFSARSHFPEAG